MSREKKPVITTRTLRNPLLPDLPPNETPYFVEGVVKLPRFGLTKSQDDVLATSGPVTDRQPLLPTNVRGVDQALRFVTYEKSDHGEKNGGWSWVRNEAGVMVRVSRARNDPYFIKLMQAKIADFNHVDDARLRLVQIADDEPSFERGEATVGLKEELYRFTDHYASNVNYADYTIIMAKIYALLGLDRYAGSKPIPKIAAYLRQENMVTALQALEDDAFDPRQALASVKLAIKVTTRDLLMLQDWEIATLDPKHQRVLQARRDQDIARFLASQAKHPAA